MRTLQFLLSLAFLGFAATLVQADGAQTQGVALPAPQPSVVVTVERGVLVWRPLGTDLSGEALYPQTASVNSGGQPQVQIIMPRSNGVTGIYGGFGHVKKHARRNGVSDGRKHVTVNIKGWPSRHHGAMKAGHFGRHHGGFHGGFKRGGAPKHVAFIVKGGGARHGGGHGSAHR